MPLFCACVVGAEPEFLVPLPAAAVFPALRCACVVLRGALGAALRLGDRLGVTRRENADVAGRRQRPIANRRADGVVRHVQRERAGDRRRRAVADDRLGGDVREGDRRIGVIELPPPVPPSVSFVTVSVLFAETVRSLTPVSAALSSIRLDVVMSSSTRPKVAPKPVVLPPPSIFAVGFALLSVVVSAFTTTSAPAAATDAPLATYASSSTFVETTPIAPATAPESPFSPDFAVAVKFGPAGVNAGINASIVTFVAVRFAVPPTNARVVRSATLAATAIAKPVPLLVTAEASASTVPLFFERAWIFCSPVVVMLMPLLEMCASVGPSR